MTFKEDNNLLQVGGGQRQRAVTDDSSLGSFNVESNDHDADIDEFSDGLTTQVSVTQLYFKWSKKLIRFIKRPNIFYIRNDLTFCLNFHKIDSLIIQDDGGESTEPEHTENTLFFGQDDEMPR